MPYVEERLRQLLDRVEREQSGAAILATPECSLEPASSYYRGIADAYSGVKAQLADILAGAC